MKYRVSDEEIIQPTGRVEVHISARREGLSFCYLELNKYHKKRFSPIIASSKPFYLHDMPIEIMAIAETIGRLEAVLAQYLERKLDEEYSHLRIEE
jgi:hypothetical protein